MRIEELRYLAFVDVFPAARLVAVPGGSGVVVFRSRRSGRRAAEAHALLGGGVLVAAGDAEHVDIEFVVVVNHTPLLLRPLGGGNGGWQRSRWGLDVVGDGSAIGGWLLVIDVSLRLLLESHLEELILVFTAARHFSSFSLPLDIWGETEEMEVWRVRRLERRG